MKLETYFSLKHIILPMSLPPETIVIKGLTVAWQGD